MPLLITLMAISMVRMTPWVVTIQLRQDINSELKTIHRINTVLVQSKDFPERPRLMYVHGDPNWNGVAHDVEMQAKAFKSVELVFHDNHVEWLKQAFVPFVTEAARGTPVRLELIFESSSSFSEEFWRIFGDEGY